MVPFFSISGSDFVEMFVGVGASLLRDLFEQAKQNSPCIIFMDEIDAVGRQRGAGLEAATTSASRPSTSCWWRWTASIRRAGSSCSPTNRADILDPALLRPGRFDRQIVVDRPDLPGGRRSSRSTHEASLSAPMSTSAPSAWNPGFTGADLANLVNEAALFAARHDKNQIDMSRWRRPLTGW